MRDILQTYLPMPAIISLLAAGTFGVWTCANTLNSILNRLDNQQRTLDLHTVHMDKQDAHSEKEDDVLDAVKTDVATLRVQTAQMQKQLDKL